MVDLIKLWEEHKTSKEVPAENIELKREEIRNLMKYGKLTESSFDVEKRIFEIECRNKNKDSVKEIKYLDNQSKWDTLRQYIRELWGETGHLGFYINKNKEVKGKITNKIEEGVVDLTLIEKWEYEDKDGGINTGIAIFGEKKPFVKGLKITESLTEKFHIYRLVSKVGDAIQTYTILSRKILENDEYEIQGMQVELCDFSDISKYTRFMKKNHVIFLNECKSSKITFKGHEDFINHLSLLNITEDKFFKNLLSIKIGEKYIYFGHPRYFERLIAGFFLSSKYDSSPYPLHLLMIGKQGGGKSKVMEALSEKIEETIPIVEGSGSTMKSLIPSFKGDLPKPGAFIESNRIVFIDEFFRILMREDKDDRENTLTHLNPLLEHKRRRFGSGNNSLDTQMTSRMFAVTNPVFGTSTMEHLVKKMDNSFISRSLIWYQDEDHYNQVINKKENELEYIDIELNNAIWRAIFDYCGSFKVDMDIIKCNAIHQEGLGCLGILSEAIREIYKTRYKHHLNCLLDGIVKLRCIIEKDLTFKASEEDYTKTKEVWLKMIENWKNGLENVRFEIREDRFY